MESSDASFILGRLIRAGGEIRCTQVRTNEQRLPLDDEQEGLKLVDALPVELRAFE